MWVVTADSHVQAQKEDAVFGQLEGDEEVRLSEQIVVRLSEEIVVSSEGAQVEFVRLDGFEQESESSREGSEHN